MIKPLFPLIRSLQAIRIYVCGVCTVRTARTLYVMLNSKYKIRVRVYLGRVRIGRHPSSESQRRAVDEFVRIIPDERRRRVAGHFASFGTRYETIVVG